jgi:hypothetical protein
MRAQSRTLLAEHDAAHQELLKMQRGEWRAHQPLSSPQAVADQSALLQLHHRIQDLQGQMQELQRCLNIARQENEALRKELAASYQLEQARTAPAAPTTATALQTTHPRPAPLTVPAQPPDTTQAAIRDLQATVQALQLQSSRVHPSAAPLTAPIAPLHRQPHLLPPL